MNVSQAFRHLVTLAVGCVVLAILLHTWLLMGLVEPVVVSGSSMAPALMGEHFFKDCPQCESTLQFGAEFFSDHLLVKCQECGQESISIAALPFRRGDRILIDRSVYQRRPPQRWEVVVLRNPQEPHKLSVKRIVGLPGETVSLQNGDLWINGEMIHKPIELQLELRLPIQVDGQPITDDSAYNVGLSRPLEFVRDFMLSAKLHVLKQGWAQLEFNDGSSKYQVKITIPEGNVELRKDGVCIGEFSVDEQMIDRIQGEQVEIEFSNFDQQLLLVIGGQVIVSQAIIEGSPAIGIADPFRTEVSGPNVELQQVKYYRDIYWTDSAVGTISRQSDRLELGESEYFVLGDNSPISLDSRSWGPVHADRLIGRVILTR